ncbi:polyphenol oxidase family protein [Paenarthrobacter sp. Z7-10]|uniref:polyphenol oxidase family protein n=1 Tax=Paenarthrobacter sp. Z7-10 TaxID=2787635 RepID=UPI003FA72A1C
MAFTDTRAGNLAFSVGDAAQTAQNRNRLAAGLGLGRAGIAFMTQVHGNEVAEIGNPVADGGDGSAVAERNGSAGVGRSEGVGTAGHGAAPTADGMVSGGTPLAVLVADCVPVVLVGTARDGQPVLAVAHAGRAGVANAVVPRTVDVMRRRGAGEIRAWLGPSVCGECYEVPDSMRAGLAAVEPATHSNTRWGTPALDLPAGVLSQLARAGVAAERIAACTMEEPELFSHRRDGAGEWPGRFAGVVYARS